MIKRRFKKSFAIIIAMSVVSTTFSGVNVNANTKKYKPEIEFITEEGNLADVDLDKLYESEVLSAELATIHSDVNTKTDELVPIIVEFKTPSTIAAKALVGEANTYAVEKKVNDDHSKFEEFLSGKTAKFKSNDENKNEGIEESSYSIKHSYYNTFNGVSMKIKGTDIPKLLESGVVRTIWSDYEVNVELPVENSEKLKSEGISPLMAQSVPLIGASELHKEGITGKGIKVGVLDTGIDYNHPDLKSRYKGGYDAVERDDDPMETTYSDWKNSGKPEFSANGSSYYTSHGTHVSGTIAGTGESEVSDYPVVGVSPDVDLYSYRVLGPYGSGSFSDINYGIEKAVSDGMNVINLSLGAGVNDPLYPTAIACNNAMLAGVVTVIASGNEGPGDSTVGTPGAASLPITVGASSTGIPLSEYSLKLGEEDFYGRLLARNFDNSYENLDGLTGNIYYCGLGGTVKDFPAEVKGNIALIERGEFALNLKIENAKKAGATSVIMYNNVEGKIEAYLGESVSAVPTVAVTKEAGIKLKEAALNGKNEVSLSKTGETKTEEDVLADFSSKGPVVNENIKPDLVAPGVSILSSYPEYINSPEDGIDYSTAYARINGTSMATPHVTAVAALILQENPEYTPFDVKSALMNTSEDLKEKYRVNETGAGRVNAYDAVHSDIAIQVNDKTLTLDENEDLKEIDFTTASLSFGKYSKSENMIEKTLGMTLKNYSDKDKNFKIEVEYNDESIGANNAAENKVVLNIEENITVKAGENKNIDATINVPSDAKEGTYEGRVIIKNSADESEDYKIPFSVKYVDPQIVVGDLSRYAISNDLEMVHMYREAGATGIINVNSSFEKLHIIYKDYNTKEVIGYKGSIDGSSIKPDFTYNIRSTVDSRASYYPIIDDNKIDPMMRTLKEGEYILEYVVEGLGEEGEFISKEVPFIIDNQDPTIQLDTLTPGAYEITPDMYSKEVIDGVEKNIIWAEGTMNDNSIAALQKMGYKITEKDLIMGAYIDGFPVLFQYGGEDGTFRLGLEETDIEMSGGCFEFTPFAMDIATSQNFKSLDRYYLMEEGTPYFNIEIEETEISQGEIFHATIAMKNLEPASKFEFTLSLDAGFDLADVRVSKELEDYAKKNNYKVKLESNIVRINSNTELSTIIEVVDENNNPVNVSGNMNILEVDEKLAREVDATRYYGNIYMRRSQVTNESGDNVTVVSKAPYESIKVNRKISGLYVSVPADGLYIMSNKIKNYEKFIWVEDNEGNIYPSVFDTGNNKFFIEGLPVTDEEIKVVADLPGHFRKEGLFIPSRILNGELTANSYYMTGQEFGPIPAGDVNKDGVIDVLDLIEMEKVYGKTSGQVEWNNTSDFNFDKYVDINDLQMIVENLGSVNEQYKGVKEPQDTAPDGRTIKSVLTDMGYYGVRATGIKLNETKVELNVGESFVLSPSVLPEDVANGEFTWLMQDGGEKYVNFNVETGEIIAKEPGSVLVGAKSRDGGFQATCKVTIKGEKPPYVKVESFELDKYELDMRVGEEQTITPIINPTEASNRAVTWQVSSDDILVVENGKITAKAEGKAFVTARCESTGQLKTCIVNVKKAELGEKPEKARNINVKDKTDNSITVTWEAPNKGPEINEYVIYLDGKYKDTVSADGILEYEIKGLRENTVYGIKVTAKTADGQESKPISENARTKKINKN